MARICRRAEALLLMAQAEGSVSARRNESGAASPSGRAGERQLRVQAHSCLVREFTELCVVQELNAHNGAPALPLRSLSAWRNRAAGSLLLLSCCALYTYV